jgi:hypothetical protein
MYQFVFALYVLLAVLLLLNYEFTREVTSQVNGTLVDSD